MPPPNVMVDSQRDSTSPASAKLALASSQPNSEADGTHSQSQGAYRQMQRKTQFHCSARCTYTQQLLSQMNISRLLPSENPNP